MKNACVFHLTYTRGFFLPSSIYLLSRRYEVIQDTQLRSPPSPAYSLLSLCTYSYFPKSHRTIIPTYIRTFRKGIYIPLYRRFLLFFGPLLFSSIYLLNFFLLFFCTIVFLSSLLATIVQCSNIHSNTQKSLNSKTSNRSLAHLLQAYQCILLC